jgi:hypothetical protein
VEGSKPNIPKEDEENEKENNIPKYRVRSRGIRAEIRTGHPQKTSKKCYKKMQIDTFPSSNGETKRAALFWVITQRVLAIPYGRFDTTIGPIFFEVAPIGWG